MMHLSDDRAQAWDELHAALPAGWWVATRPRNWPGAYGRLLPVECRGKELAEHPHVVAPCRRFGVGDGLGLALWTL
jgi:hypothetical protein